MADQPGTDAVPGGRDAGAGERQGDHHPTIHRVPRRDEPILWARSRSGSVWRCGACGASPNACRCGSPRGWLGPTCRSIPCRWGRTHLVHLLFPPNAARRCAGGGAALAPRANLPLAAVWGFLGGGADRISSAIFRSTRFRREAPAGYWRRRRKLPASRRSPRPAVGCSTARPGPPQRLPSAESASPGTNPPGT